LFEAISNKPGIQAKELLSILNDRSMRTIERQIKQLTDKNLIERRGSLKNRRIPPEKDMKIKNEEGYCI
jgi:DNA-binding MarR family transcriptional regulator